MIKQAGIVVVALFLLTAAGFGQDERLSVSLGGGEAFSRQTSGNASTLAPTQNFVFLSSLRMRVATQGLARGQFRARNQLPELLCQYAGLPHPVHGDGV